MYDAMEEIVVLLHTAIAEQDWDLVQEALQDLESLIETQDEEDNAFGGAD